MLGEVEARAGFEKFSVVRFDKFGCLGVKNLVRGLPDHLAAGKAPQSFRRSVDQYILQRPRVLHQDGHRHIVDHPVQKLAVAIALLLRPHPFGNIDDRAQQGRSVLIVQLVAVDVDQNIAAVGSAVPAHGCRIEFESLRSAVGADQLGMVLSILGWKNIEHPHREKLLARISIVPHRRVIDGKELQITAVDDQHRHRIGFEQRPHRLFALLDFGDIDADADAAAIGGPPFADPMPAVVGQLLLMHAVGLRVQRESLSQPLLFAPARLGISARGQAGAQGILETGAHLDGARGERIELGITLVPHHVAIFGVEQRQTSGHHLEGIAQARMRGGRLLLGPRGFSQGFFQRDLGFSLSRDLFVNRDPAAVVHEAVHDADRSSVGNLENRVHLAALDDLVGEICIDVAGEGAVCGA